MTDTPLRRLAGPVVLVVVLAFTAVWYAIRPSGRANPVLDDPTCHALSTWNGTGGQLIRGRGIGVDAITCTWYQSLPPATTITIAVAPDPAPLAVGCHLVAWDRSTTTAACPHDVILVAGRAAGRWITVTCRSDEDDDDLGQHHVILCRTVHSAIAEIAEA